MVGVKCPVIATGLLMGKELEYFHKALSNPNRPLLAILGGAKVSDKIHLINNLIDKVDELIIAGGMAFTFKKVVFGVKIGKSIFDKEGAKIVNDIVEKAKKKGVKLHFPIDYKCGDKFSNDANVTIHSDETGGIPDDLEGMDAGPKSIELFKEVINRAKVIVWNGPCGVFEFKKFSVGSEELVNMVCKVTKENNCTTVIGGGDTASLISNLGKGDQVSHLSTGGGASMELLEGKKLPGVEYIPDKK